MRKLVLASRNKGKIKEMQGLLSGLPLEIVSLDNYPQAPEVAETGATFQENAVMKAKTLAAYTKELTLADDSGLEIDFLGGEPGVHSARYGEAGWNDQERYEYLLKKLELVSGSLRQARFRSVIAVYDPETGRLELAEGKVEGVIIDEPRGDYGFGYDPVFYLPELRKTMAELTPEQKNELSHRARAVKQIIPQLEKFLK